MARQSRLASAVKRADVPGVVVVKAARKVTGVPEQRPQGGPLGLFAPASRIESISSLARPSLRPVTTPPPRSVPKKSRQPRLGLTLAPSCTVVPKWGWRAPASHSRVPAESLVLSFVGPLAYPRRACARMAGLFPRQSTRSSALAAKIARKA